MKGRRREKGREKGREEEEEEERYGNHGFVWNCCMDAMMLYGTC